MSNYVQRFHKFCKPFLSTVYYIFSPVNNIQIVTDDEATIENYFPEVGNIPRGGNTSGNIPNFSKTLFPTSKTFRNMATVKKTFCLAPRSTTVVHMIPRELTNYLIS